MRISDWSSTCALPISCRRTQYLQRRNAIALDGEIGGDAVADADPGNGQRGQPDQRQELAHAFEKAAGSRRGAVTLLDFEPRRRKGAFQGLARCADLRARCDPNAVFAFIKTAGLDQRGTTDTFDPR